MDDGQDVISASDVTVPQNGGAKGDLPSKRPESEQKKKKET